MSTAQDVVDVALTPVDSSMIKAVGYDAATSTLLVRFTDGQVYSYTDVPPEEYQGLLAAESHGKYFWRRIRNEYAFAKRGKL